MTSTIVPTPPVGQRKKPLNTPKFSIIAAILLIILAITAIVIGTIVHTDITPIMGFIALAIPTLLSSAYSERNSNDLRNGVVQESATQGAISALHSTGMVETSINMAESLLTNKTAMPMAMQALSRLLELNTAATNVNTAGQHDTNNPASPVQVVPIPGHAIVIAPAEAPPVQTFTPPVQTFTPQVQSAGGKTNG